MFRLVLDCTFGSVVWLVHVLRVDHAKKKKTPRKVSTVIVSKGTVQSAVHCGESDNSDTFVLNFSFL